jgi:hypothetical protein
VVFGVPLFIIDAESPYDAGVQHGALARTQINAWLKSEEMSSLQRFVSSPVGNASFSKLQERNAREFPILVDEMRGISVGANVSQQSIWLINLLYEMEALMGEEREPNISTRPNDHCTDVYATASDGYSSGFSLGHNEDWSQAVKPYWYWLKQSVKGSASCAGLAYPGTLIGYAPTWNEHGIFSTMNSIFPLKNNAEGLGCVFVQRSAICSSKSLTEVVKTLSVSGWSSGASLNLVDLNLPNSNMANLEIWESEHVLYNVSTNYSHENMFKSQKFRAQGLDPVDLSTAHRQDRLDSLPAPHSVADIVARLGDTHDPDFPIYRPTTLTTVVLDGKKRELSVWEDSNPGSSLPVHTWDLTSFFQVRCNCSNGKCGAWLC